MRQLLVLCSSLFLAGSAAGAPGTLVPLSPGEGVLRVQACGIETSISGSLPLTLPFNLSFGGCTVTGSADIQSLGGALALTMRKVSLSIGVSVQATGTLDDFSFDGPELVGSVSPVYTSLSNSLSESGGVTLDLMSFASSGRYKSSLLAGQLDGAFGGVALSGPHFFIANDLVTYLTTTAPVAAAATIDARWDGSLTNTSNFEATVLFEVFRPPGAALPALALSAPGRVALATGLLAAATFFTARRRRGDPEMVGQAVRDGADDRT